MTHPIFWTEVIPGLSGFPGHTLTASLVMLLLIGFALLANRSLASARADGDALIPDERMTIRNIAELFVGGVLSIGEGVLGKRAAQYVPLFGSFFIFILLANLIGLVPGFSPPTSDFNVTFALGAAAFLGYNAIGIADQGIVNYAKHFVGPIWWLAVLMVPLELIDNLVRPVSLALRLFGNMTGDHLVLEIFTDLTRVVIPVAFYFLGAFVSLIQAFVFTLLTVIYVSLALGHDDAHH